MDVVYLVRGYLSAEDKEKRVFYNGKSPTKAFDYFDEYSKKAEIVVEVYEDGFLVRTFTE